MKQIFIKSVPNEILFGILETICLKTSRYYFIDLNSYRKFLYQDLHLEFIEKIRPFYHTSKWEYLDRRMTYNSFTNLIRQICKHNHVAFTSKINYNKSDYNIDYYVYIPQPPLTSGSSKNLMSSKGSSRNLANMESKESVSVN
jgi:hypothetical protein